jgi:hypothetical protein
MIETWFFCTFLLLCANFCDNVCIQFSWSGVVKSCGKLCLSFRGNVKLFSKAATPFDSPISTAWRFQFLHIFTSFFPLSLNTGVWTQSFALVRKVFYHCNHVSNPFHFTYFSSSVSHFLPDLWLISNIFGKCFWDFGWNYIKFVCQIVRNLTS